MIRRLRAALCVGISAFAVVVAGCATVDITKTAKGAFAATNPNDVEILSTFPKNKDYIELATVATTNWDPDETAKMHNALRAKSAPIGANAVILFNSGVDPQGDLWCTGAAIRYTVQSE